MLETLPEGGQLPQVVAGESLFLEESGEDRVTDIKELVLRDRNIVDVEHIDRLISLEVLSLSHNRLVSLSGFESLENLMDVNLNNNQISDIRPLASCTRIQNLFLACNKIRNADALEACKKLRKISLFRNFLPKLEDVVATFSTLPELQEIDLDGNPFSFSVEYKSVTVLSQFHALLTNSSRHKVVKSLPELKALDGDAISRFDRELADDFFSGAVSKQKLSRPTSAPANRPRTAPMGGRPQSSEKLFRDERLNNNPILMEYLAEQKLAEVNNQRWGSGWSITGQPETSGPLSARPSTALPSRRPESAASARPASSVGQRPRTPDRGSQSSPDTDPLQRPTTPASELSRKSSNSSFVSKLRTTAEVMNQYEDEPVENIVTQEEEREAAACLSSDNPQEIINRLIQTVEMLQTERDSLQKYVEDSKKRGTPSASMKEENRRLKMENANMYAIEEENRRLKDMIENRSEMPLTTPRGTPIKDPKEQKLLDLKIEINKLKLENSNMFAVQEENTELRNQLQEVEDRKDPEGRTFDDLVKENSRLKRQIRAYKQENNRLHQENEEIVASTPRPGTAASMSSVYSTTEEILEEAEDFDEEIAALFKRNSKTLDKLKRDLQKTKAIVGDSKGSDMQPTPPRRPSAGSSSVTSPPSPRRSSLPQRITANGMVVGQSIRR